MHHFWTCCSPGDRWAFSLIATIESRAFRIPAARTCCCWLLTIARPRDAVLCALLAVIGSLIGSAIFFEIMRRGGERFLATLHVFRPGRPLPAWFLRYGLVTVFIPALLPIPFLPFKVVRGLRRRHGRQPDAIHAGAGRGAHSALLRAWRTWARNWARIRWPG